jgi:hypothetical protein
MDRRPIQLAPGQSEVIRFERGDWSPGFHQVVVQLGTKDAALPFNDVRYATFLVRGSRKVLTITDRRQSEAHDPIWAMALRAGRAFDSEVKLTSEAARLSPKELSTYRAICLLGVTNPSEELWETLKQYVDQGGGLAVIPGGSEIDRASYNNNKAQTLLPAKLEKPMAMPEKNYLTWNWAEAKKHPLMAPFLEWRANKNVDFFQPGWEPQVFRYWKVDPQTNAADEIIPYSGNDKPPALLERRFDRKQVRGRVLLFTTALDDAHIHPEDRRQAWNDFLQSSFYLVLAQRTVGYLSGETEDANINFLCGQSVPVALPSTVRFPSYTIVGPGLKGQEAIINRAEKQVELNITHAVQPGNYRVVGKDTTVAAFTLNVPPEESRLDRVPPEQIEALLGEGSLMTVDQKISLSDALQSHWSQPIELLPLLMIVILLALAVENLLANKFYRQEPQEKESPPLGGTP